MAQEDQENRKEGGIEGKIHAVTELVKAVPIYQDAIQPFAKEAGKALELVGRTVNAALAPVRGVVWGVEKIQEFVNVKVSEKLKDVPVDEIITPDLSVAGPVLESLRFAGHKEELCEMYANLLAASMTNGIASSAHPGFVEIIRNLCSDEAKLLRYISEKTQTPFIDVRRFRRSDGTFKTIFQLVSTAAYHAGCEELTSISAYVVNLQRLGLVDVDRTKRLTGDAYDEILNEPEFKFARESKVDDEYYVDTVNYIVEISALGRQFCKICVG